MDFLNLDNGALNNRAAASAVGILNALATQDRRTGRKIRALDAFHESCQQFFTRGIRMLKCPLHTLGHLTQVMRRDARGHIHGNTFRPVDQQVRNTRRQDRRLLGAPIVVVLEVNSVFINVAHHFHRQGRHLTFGITRGSRPQVTGRTKVTLTGNERVTH